MLERLFSLPSLYIFQRQTRREQVKALQPAEKESLGGITQMSDSFEDSFEGVSPRINSVKSLGRTTQRNCSVTLATTSNIQGRTINAKQPPERIIEDL